jgi:hypothetical protein
VESGEQSMTEQQKIDPTRLPGRTEPSPTPSSSYVANNSSSSIDRVSLDIESTYRDENVVGLQQAKHHLHQG